MLAVLHTDTFDWSSPAHAARPDAASTPRESYRDIVAACPAMMGKQEPAANARRRARGALTARGTRRKPVHGGSLAASMPPTVPQSARTPHQQLAGGFVEERGHRVARFDARLLKPARTNHPNWSLPARRRGTFGGMDAAKELTRTYLQRVPRW
ncbi:hypothetical protein XACM_3958 [Xanthomonas euvesicatoria pv. citrumelo F1]|nr:hypothetical protein XACM_3958 [Xanthomonas euvesicatoria pv. citrumelo F1]